MKKQIEKQVEEVMESLEKILAGKYVPSLTINYDAWYNEIYDRIENQQSYELPANLSKYNKSKVWNF